MDRSPVRLEDGPPPTGVYSPGIVAGGLVFISGQAPYEADGSLVGGPVADQVRQTLTNVDRIARAAGSSLARAAHVRIYLSSLEHFDEMDAAYGEFFDQEPPARTTIQSDLIGFDVEIDAVVVVE